MAETKQSFAVPQHGEFCWLELGTTDVEAAKKFYSELLGWNLKTSAAVPGFEYTEFGNGDKPIGGMYQLTSECKDASGEPLKSDWRSYIAVDDVDSAASRVFDLGGKICVPPMDIPNVGRFCVINDPTGATISLISMKN